MAKLEKSSAAKRKPREKTGDPVLGANIRAIRLRAGKRLHELGLSKALVSQFESGTTMPSVPALKTLAENLGCGIDALIWGAAAGRFHKATEPPRAELDRRIHALPEAMREFVLLALTRAETAAHKVPAQFLKPPTGDTWSHYAAYLEAITEKSKREK